MKNIKVKYIVLSVFLLVLLGVGIFYGYRFFSSRSEKTSQKISEQSKTKVTINEKVLELETAKNKYQRNFGLMFRESIPENGGMLFFFDSPGTYTFWMKNTKIPLDIIWINENKQIVYIQKNAQPCANDPCEEFSPEPPAKYVIETSAGWVDKNNIQVGNTVSF